MYIYMYTFVFMYVYLFMYIYSEDCFYYCSERNNVVVLFGILKVQF